MIREFCWIVKTCIEPDKAEGNLGQEGYGEFIRPPPPLGYKKIIHYNTLTWPQNAGKHISEDHNYKSFPGKYICTLEPPTGDCLGLSVSRTPFKNPVSAPAKNSPSHVQYVFMPHKMFFTSSVTFYWTKKAESKSNLQWVTNVLRHFIVKFQFRTSWKYYLSSRTKSNFNQGMRSATITEGSAPCESTEWYNTLLAESARCVCSFLLSVFLGKIYVTLTALRWDKVMRNEATLFCH